MSVITHSSLGDNHFKEHAITTLKPDKFSYTWRIHNFDTTPFESYRRDLKSPKFVKRHFSTIITLWISFIERNEIKKKKRRQFKRIELALIGHVSEECKLFAKFQFFIVHEHIQRSVGSCVMEAIQVYQSGSELNFAKCSLPIDIEELIRVEGFCPNGILTIQCDITLLNEQIEMIEQHIPDCQLYNDLLNLLGSSKNLCDITLVVNGNEYYAHKFILAAHSSVFTAMLENESMDKMTTIVLNGIGDIFEQVLQYIYMGRISTDTVEAAAELAVFADKYDINKLRIMCAVYIDKNLTNDNVTDVLIVADVRHSISLKLQAIKFINVHMTNVMDTDGYKSMCKSHPHIAQQFFFTRMKRLLDRRSVQ